MKVGIAFFLSLCFFLFTGNGSAYATTIQQSGNSYLPPSFVNNAKQINLNSENSRSPILRKDIVSEKKADVISIEDEDEDLISARKHLLLVKCFIVLAFTPFLIHLFKDFKNRLPLCKHLSYTSSYKYLLQRVLRI